MDKRQATEQKQTKELDFSKHAAQVVILNFGPKIN